MVGDGSMKVAKLRGHQQGFLINLVAIRVASVVPAFWAARKG
jgi:hypothetical protein